MISANTTAQDRGTLRRVGGILGLGAGLLMAGPALGQNITDPGDTNASGADRYQTETEGGLFSQAFDYITNNSYFRVGVLHFQYYGDSTPIQVDDAQGLAAQAFGPGESEIDSTGSSVGNKTTLGGTYGLFIPKTGRHLAVEIMLAPPLKLDFEVSKNAIDESLAPNALNGENADPLPTGVPPLGRKIGTLKALPPNFTLVYRPWVDTMIQPYVGVGAIYLYTYDTDVSNKVLNAYGNEPTLNLTKPVGCIGQLGADFQLPDNMFITADVKYVGCADVEATVNNIKVNSPTLSPTFGPIDVGSVSTTAHFEAIIYQFSFGMRF